MVTLAGKKAQPEKNSTLPTPTREFKRFFQSARCDGCSSRRRVLFEKQSDRIRNDLAGKKQFTGAIEVRFDRVL